MKRYSGSDALPQDFVLNVLKEKQSGYYVEVGAWHSKQGSTTFILEKDFNWSGVGLEIVKSRVDEYNLNRKNPCILHDGSTFDYKKYFEENNFPKQIDYLQIDVDENPANISLLTLINMPLSTYRFSVIVFEHLEEMSYKYKFIKEMSEKILDMYGYIRIFSSGLDDWWVDPKVVDQAIYKRFFHKQSIRSEFLENNNPNFLEPYEQGEYPIDRPTF
jgi:hypothetical protein